MPTYQYACTACGEQLEAVQSFSDASLTTCPACEGALRKVFSAVGVVFKGSGFYKTDSRKAASVGDSSSKGAADKGSGDKGSGDKGSSDKGSGDKAATPKKSDAPAAGAGSTTKTATSSRPAAASTSH